MNKTALAILAQFTGTENYYRHLGIRYTDGVQFLAQNANCFWLIDAIASHQLTLRENPRLFDFQLWELGVANEGGFSSAVLICTDGDSEIPIMTQRIERTDFPLPSIQLYVERGRAVAFRPSID